MTRYGRCLLILSLDDTVSWADQVSQARVIAVSAGHRYAGRMSNLHRVTSDPAICHGKPVVRGLRYPSLTCSTCLLQACLSRTSSTITLTLSVRTCWLPGVRCVGRGEPRGRPFDAA